MSLAAACVLLALSIPRAALTAATQSEETLPDGPGRKILQSACASCHELTEVTKFRGYYGADEWRDIVITMVKYGAPVAESEVKVLVDYLARNFGKKEQARAITASSRR